MEQEYRVFAPFTHCLEMEKEILSVGKKIGLVAQYNIPSGYQIVCVTEKSITIVNTETVKCVLTYQISKDGINYNYYTYPGKMLEKDKTLNK